jgi:hypothetical protein
LTIFDPPARFTIALDLVVVALVGDWALAGSESCRKPQLSRTSRALPATGHRVAPSFPTGSLGLVIQAISLASEALTIVRAGVAVSGFIAEQPPGLTLPLRPAHRNVRRQAAGADIDRMTAPPLTGPGANDQRPIAAVAPDRPARLSLEPPQQLQLDKPPLHQQDPLMAAR